MSGEADGGEPVAGEPLWTTSEVATFFRVSPKTVTRWARRGLLPRARTPGRHRRFRESDVLATAYGDLPGRPRS